MIDQRKIIIVKSEKQNKTLNAQDILLINIGISIRALKNWSLKNDLHDYDHVEDLK